MGSRELIGNGSNCGRDGGDVSCQRMAEIGAGERLLGIGVTCKELAEMGVGGGIARSCCKLPKYGGNAGRGGAAGSWQKMVERWRREGLSRPARK